MAATRVGRRGVLRGLIADRQPLWQNALATTLFHLGFGSVCLCECPDELVEVVRRTRPHLAVVEAEAFPEFGEALREAAAGTHVVVASAGTAVDASIGPDATTTCMSKCSSPQEIEQTLRRAVATHLEWATLTRRELEILRLAADGRSNREIAAALWLSDQTVKFHLAQAYRRLRVSNRRAAVERVRELGLLGDDAEPLIVEELVEQIRTVAAEAR
jgi:DNA-binding NarL/FixJ family response regulator